MGATHFRGGTISWKPIGNGTKVFYVLIPFYHGIGATHFRGGTISWKPNGNGTEVEFSFKLGWAYNRGPGCTAERIGQFIDEVIPYYWKCTTGCSTPRNIANTSYICTGASESENWEQGENTFTYTFPGIGPYTVDAQYGCYNEISIPVVDPDGDDVRCRWANGTECMSICEGLPYATIDYFIVETPVLPAVNCTDKPRIANIDLTVPAGMEYTSLQSDVYTNYSYVHSSWIPEQNQVGFHLVCAIAKDPLGKTSKPRCITVVVNDVSPCGINPCEHGGTCLRQDITQNYVCTCLPGYTGNYCDTGVRPEEQILNVLNEFSLADPGHSCFPHKCLIAIPLLQEHVNPLSTNFHTVSQTKNTSDLPQTSFFFPNC
uniref:Uncharacterized protein n=1 Tax=Magallana gigas TaxID=29159 RepID=K1PRY6_MAGGI